MKNSVFDYRINRFQTMARAVLLQSILLIGHIVDITDVSYMIVLNSF